MYWKYRDNRPSCADENWLQEDNSCLKNWQSFKSRNSLHFFGNEHLQWHSQTDCQRYLCGTRQIQFMPSSPISVRSTKCFIFQVYKSSNVLQWNYLNTRFKHKVCLKLAAQKRETNRWHGLISSTFCHHTDEQHTASNTEKSTQCRESKCGIWAHAVSLLAQADHDADWWANVYTKSQPLHCTIMTKNIKCSEG